MGQVNHEYIQVSENTSVTRVQNCDNTDRGDGAYELVSLSGEYAKHLSSVVINKVNKLSITYYIDYKIFFDSYLYLIKKVSNLIYNSLKLLVSTNDILFLVHSIINSNSHIIVTSQFKFCLDNNTSKLKELHRNLLDLLESYSSFHYLEMETRNIIKFGEHIPSFKTKVSQITNKFSSSLSEFNKIEDRIKCVKSKIQEITPSKNQLLVITGSSPSHFKFFYLQIKSCCDNIDRLCWAIYDVEFYTLCLKYWIFKFVNESNTNNILLSAIYANYINNISFKSLPLTIQNFKLYLYVQFLSFFSYLSIQDSYFVSLHFSSIIDHMKEGLETLKLANNCSCVLSYEKNIKKDKFDFISFPILFTNKDFDLINNIENSHNHLCLCLVIKYSFVPSIYRFLYHLFYIYDETLATHYRKHDKYLKNVNLISDMSKLIFLVLGMIEKIVIIMERRYISEPRSNPLSFIIKDTNWPCWFIVFLSILLCMDIKSIFSLLICFCKFPNDEYYPYLISIILFVSSLIENIWTMDSESIREAIQSVMWMVSDYHSMGYYPHRPNISSYTNNNSTSNANTTSSLSMTLNQYIKTISITTRPKNGTCNSTGNGQSSMVLHTEISKSEAVLVDKNLKLLFKSLFSSLSILISTPLFSLAYSNISGLAFYIIGNKPIIGFSSIFLRRVVNSISVKYLECTKKEQECTCVDKKECKMCVVFKINVLTLSITMKMVKYVLASFITDLITKSRSFNQIITDMSRVIINDTELILRRTKNNLLTSSANVSINATNVTSVRNWGYDTYHQHDVTTNSFSDV